VALFEEAWREREAAMRDFPGFQGFTLTRDGDGFVASSSWASIPEWEAWSLSEPCRRSHLPLGVWQYVPAKGEVRGGGRGATGALARRRGARKDRRRGSRGRFPCLLRDGTSCPHP
jgi:hypothetical protein